MKGSLNSHVFYISKMIGSVPLFFSGCCFGKKIHLICWVAGSPSRLTSFPFSLEFPQKNRKTIFCTFKIKTEKKKNKKKDPSEEILYTQGKLTSSLTKQQVFLALFGPEDFLFHLPILLYIVAVKFTDLVNQAMPRIVLNMLDFCIQ